MSGEAGGRRPWLGALKLAFGVGLLALLLAQIDGAELMAAFREAQPGPVVAGLVAFAALFVAQALRLHLLIGAMTGRLVETFRLVMVGFFFNQFLPSSVGGDTYKVVALSRGGHDWRRGLGLVALDRIASMLVAVAAGAVYVLIWGLPELDPLLRGRELPWGWIAVGAGAAMAVAGLGLWWVARGGRLSRLAALVRAVPPAAAAGVLALSVVTLLLRALRLYLFALAVGMAVGYADMIYVLFLITVVAFVPLSVGGIGLQEGVIAYGLAVFAVPLGAGMAIALLNRGATWLAALAGGAIYLRVRPAGVPGPVPPARPAGPNEDGSP